MSILMMAIGKDLSIYSNYDFIYPARLKKLRLLGLDELGYTKHNSSFIDIMLNSNDQVLLINPSDTCITDNKIMFVFDYMVKKLVEHNKNPINSLKLNISSTGLQLYNMTDLGNKKEDVYTISRFFKYSKQRYYGDEYNSNYSKWFELFGLGRMKLYNGIDEKLSIHDKLEIPYMTSISMLHKMESEYFDELDKRFKFLSVRVPLALMHTLMDIAIDSKYNLLPIMYYKIANECVLIADRNFDCTNCIKIVENDHCGEVTNNILKSNMLNIGGD